ncbi:hypothetical protein GURKE_03330 [Brevundimonas phage vB_BpoS-Gurke]|uniref:Uncharacterized protein n=1 Tax=Brevundimonas phage vB_BpoS-Gurke TaxID=2948599 RepID=A0A9E7N1X7_9CAUD|nr:hypothetical protein GURKE_03330 [Brevundimonas phage vB_BpoS-Gurke]
MEDCNCQVAGNHLLITLHAPDGAVLDYVRQDCPVHGLYESEDGVKTWLWRRCAPVED